MQEGYIFVIALLYLLFFVLIIAFFCVRNEWKGDNYRTDMTRRSRRHFEYSLYMSSVAFWEGFFE